MLPRAAFVQVECCVIGVECCGKVFERVQAFESDSDGEKVACALSGRLNRRSKKVNQAGVRR